MRHPLAGVAVDLAQDKIGLDYVDWVDVEPKPFLLGALKERPCSLIKLLPQVAW
jgi:hypothetical protein